MGSQHLHPSIPCSSSWFPNSPQTLGRNGKGTWPELCHQKLLWDVPLQHGELLSLGNQIQVPVQQSPVLYPGDLDSIPTPAHPGTQEVPKCRALALAARAGELQPAHPAPNHTAPGPLRHRASPHTHLCISFKEFIRSKYLHLLQMVNRQHGTESSPWVEKETARANCSPPPLPGSRGQPSQPQVAQMNRQLDESPFPSQGNPQQAPPLPRIKASRSPDNWLSRLKDGWEKGCNRSEATAPTPGSKSALLAFGVGTDSAVPKGRSGGDHGGSRLLALTLRGQEGTKLSTFLLSCLPQEPDQHKGED